jgi:CheY-like chemotaxis protein
MDLDGHAHHLAAARRRGMQPNAPARGAVPDPGERVEKIPVLVVDDDAASAKLVAIILRGEGFDVRVATSAEEALDALPEHRPLVIVLDLVLPRMSGLLFIQKIKADPATRHMVVVAVTAFNGQQSEKMATDAGCAAFVRKPIDALSFAQLVRAHFSSAQ